MLSFTSTSSRFRSQETNFASRRPVRGQFPPATEDATIDHRKGERSDTEQSGTAHSKELSDEDPIDLSSDDESYDSEHTLVDELSNVWPYLHTSASNATANTIPSEENGEAPRSRSSEPSLSTSGRPQARHSPSPSPSATDEGDDIEEEQSTKPKPKSTVRKTRRLRWTFDLEHWLMNAIMTYKHLNPHGRIHRAGIYKAFCERWEGVQPMGHKRPIANIERGAFQARVERMIRELKQPTWGLLTEAGDLREDLVDPDWEAKLIAHRKEQKRLQRKKKQDNAVSEEYVPPLLSGEQLFELAHSIQDC